MQRKIVLRTSKDGYFKVCSKSSDVLLMESDQSLIDQDFVWLDEIITGEVGQG